MSALLADQPFWINCIITSHSHPCLNMFSFILSVPFHAYNPIHSPLLSQRSQTPTMRIKAPRLLTWDIDGTLLRAGGPSGNAAHKLSLEDAIFHIHQIRTSVNNVPHAGSTDIAITRALCQKHDLPESSIPSILEEASKRIATYLSEVDLRSLVLPGVSKTLESVRNYGVSQALTTGNMKAAAWEKMDAAGLTQYFCGGGFGDEKENRAEILKLTIQRYGQGCDVNDVVHVGDAIQDVRAAKEVGATPVAVLTGAFGREELEREGAVAVLEDLEDVQQFLKIIGLDLA